MKDWKERFDELDLTGLGLLIRTERDGLLVKAGLQTIENFIESLLKEREEAFKWKVIGYINGLDHSPREEYIERDINALLNDTTSV